MRRIRCCLLILIALWGMSVPFHHEGFANPARQVILTVSASDQSTAESRLIILDHRTFGDLSRSGVRKPARTIPVSDASLTLFDGQAAVTYLVDRQGNLFDEKTNQVLLLEEAKRAELLKYIDYVRSHYYGTMLEWEEASALIPKKAKFQVIDLDTGLSFRVQRRAGKHHADVQPLTKEDTRIMKQIYNGTWSWKRRAILVKAGDRYLAASMHGMPHGADGIRNNGVRGHFCIHFLGSTTHGSRQIDPEHQLLIKKAAGRTKQYLDQASPYEVIDTFLVALNLNESRIVKMCFLQPSHPQVEEIVRLRNEITGLAKRSPPEIEDHENVLTMEIPVDVSISRKGRRDEKTTFVFHMKRLSVMAPWKIDFIDANM